MTPEQFNHMIDTELSNFEAAFVQYGNAPLITAEKAILRTYIIWKAGLAAPPTKQEGTAPPFEREGL